MEATDVWIDIETANSRNHFTKSAQAHSTERNKMKGWYATQHSTIPLSNQLH